MQLFIQIYGDWDTSYKINYVGSDETAARRVDLSLIDNDNGGTVNLEIWSNGERLSEETFLEEFGWTDNQ